MTCLLVAENSETNLSGKSLAFSGTNPILRQPKNLVCLENPSVQLNQITLRCSIYTIICQMRACLLVMYFYSLQHQFVVMSAP
jgi:hypothetical protein